MVVPHERGTDISSYVGVAVYESTRIRTAQKRGRVSRLFG